MKILDRYIARQLLGVTALGVMALSALLLLGNLFKELRPLLVENKAPISIVLEFIFQVIPFSLMFSIPWGFLTAVLLVYGRLASDNELTSMRMSGMSLWRLSAPAIAIGIAAAGGDPEILNIVEDTTHQSAADIMTAKGVVDLLIPRGGAGLIRACVAGATVPCIETGTGICHVYVDAAADLDKALDIVENAKVSRPSVCNAEEVLLVHSAVAADFLPRLQKRLVTDRAAAGKPPVELRLDSRAAAMIPGTPAGEKDFDTEFLNYILAVRVVDSVAEAVAHIAAHSTGHSDAIVTEDPAAADAFVAGVDSAAVYVNASTRFTDGGEFGLGCEMGISTQKLHARGPMGLDELSTYKYVIRGSGQIR